MSHVEGHWYALYSVPLPKDFVGKDNYSTVRNSVQSWGLWLLIEDIRGQNRTLNHHIPWSIRADSNGVLISYF